MYTFQTNEQLRRVYAHEVTVGDIEIADQLLTAEQRTDKLRHRERARAAVR